jgi:hypothetical protein
VGAEVELAPEALPFSAVDVPKLLLKLDCQSGIASYQKADRVQAIMDAFQPTEKGFVFIWIRLEGVVPPRGCPCGNRWISCCGEFQAVTIKNGEDSLWRAGRIRHIGKTTLRQLPAYFCGLHRRRHAVHENVPSSRPAE